MVAYTQNELVSATEISKQFGEYISKVKNGVVDKIGVLKNNKLNAIILSVDEYENMVETINAMEDMQIYEEIKDRLKSPKNELLDGNNVLKKYGLSLDV
ncbi:MAG: type II toxin-antitoxin system Phd/YefM family antitoxin [Sulfurospirillum sp.]|nr:type II toxin-antitoxin system Phd/YefM family antitoxin [Sulfurospirillum sp.]MBL0702519.1 type II toxin-antitoxin system Phd/YefM family antitoxin [Sulfurospirillum sp.]